MKSQFQELRQIMTEEGIIIRIARKGDNNKIGIHKLYPDMADLQNACDVALRDGFKVIYVHNSYTWRS